MKKMNTENKKEIIVLPADFHFEKPTLTEFTYNKVASVQGASGGGVDNPLAADTEFDVIRDIEKSWF